MLYIFSPCTLASVNHGLVNDFLSAVSDVQPAGVFVAFPGLSMTDWDWLETLDGTLVCLHVDCFEIEE